MIVKRMDSMSRLRVPILGAAGVGATLYVLLPSRFKPTKREMGPLTTTGNIKSTSSAGKEHADSGGGLKNHGELEALFSEMLQWSLFKADHGVGLVEVRKSCQIRMTSWVILLIHFHPMFQGPTLYENRRPFPASYFWRITPPHEGVPSYLLGTIHMPQLFPFLSRNIKDATQVNNQPCFHNITITVWIWIGLDFRPN